jgi:neutral ceramidase
MSLGHYKQNLAKIVQGIVESIQEAHKNIKPGHIKFNEGKLRNSNINRSPTAYEGNPKEERDKYPDGNTNDNMSVLRLEDTQGNELGAISWFSVHTTSVANSNYLISGDNKGWASLLFEKFKNGIETPSGVGSFLAAFPEPPSGDISPNTRGAFCPNGQKCDINSTCNGNSNLCHGLGPGKDDLESAKILGINQFESANRIYSAAKLPISGSVDSRHIFINMSTFTVLPEYSSTGNTEKTCRAALGYSFAAGTTDGPGGFNFWQGNNGSTNPFWNIIRNFISKPTEEQIKCHLPKPIFLDVGTKRPYSWTPEILPVQLFKVGQLLFANVPGEFTVMSGRRIQEILKRTAEKEGFIQNAIVMVSTMSNTYSQYTTTFEEFKIQRYEGASTLYGPHTLAAYTQTLDKLLISMIKNQPVETGPSPPDHSNEQISFITPVVLDTHPTGKRFGFCEVQPKETYKVGETVEVQFYSAHLDNNFDKVSTYLTVERKEGNEWKLFKTDADFDTTIQWKRKWRNLVLPDSMVTLKWRIDGYTRAGEYRISHMGFAKESATSSKLTPYSGTSREFKVVQ